MTFPPALVALVIPAGLFAAWLFLHKDADVEQRIDKKEAVHERESASFDRDFARITGDKQGEKSADARMKEAQKQVEASVKARQERANSDQREAVRSGVDEFLKPKAEGEK
ncbi:hypothetical protein [Acidovorax sp. FJL06]|uniref:hypothetical protein n=1 Tax=Acidovorax sp. FJL06 TaxID=2153365 RepID=UPI000F55BE9E|nr:hypothetical protein [Acidovorax sp. FJL06]